MLCRLEASHADRTHSDATRSEAAFHATVCRYASRACPAAAVPRLHLGIYVCHEGGPIEPARGHVCC